MKSLAVKHPQLLHWKKMLINTNVPALWMMTPFSSHFRWDKVAADLSKPCSEEDIEEAFNSLPSLHGAGDRDLSEENLNYLRQSMLPYFQKMTFTNITKDFVNRNHLHLKRKSKEEKHQ